VTGELRLADRVRRRNHQADLCAPTVHTTALNGSGLNTWPTGRGDCPEKRVGRRVAAPATPCPDGASGTERTRLDAARVQSKQCPGGVQSLLGGVAGRAGRPWG
jgi:hypothetical protein